KSLLAVTRVTPAYRLFRKQGHEYVILYGIYFGDVQLLGLKEGFQVVRVGTVWTPIGTITLTCAYRTNLAFMSTLQFEKTQPIMGIIIDHFVDRPLPSTSHMHPCNYRASEEQGTIYPSVEDSQDVCATSFYTSPPSQMMVPGKEGDYPTSLPSLRMVLKLNVIGGSPNKTPHILFTHKIGAFVDKSSPQVTYASTDIPFAVFAPKLAELEEHDPMVMCPDSPEEVSPDARSLQSSCSSSEVPQDDFVMVDFRPAFSKYVLQLSSLSIDIAVQSMTEDLDYLPEKLAMHEKNMEEFDAFVESLQEDEGP
ncbi:hypothetical protein AB205_0153960, partial [Aquarana catesbeiana]